MNQISSIVAWTAVISAFGGMGCSTSHISARALPMELRAASRDGIERVQLGGLLSGTPSSTAIGANDLLEVTVFTGLAGEEPQTDRLRVGADGRVDTPLIGRVPVAGLEPSQAADQIASAAIQSRVYVRPQVSVVVAEQATQQVTVLGAVGEPGVQNVPRVGCDVLTAIAAAGGFTEEAGVMVEVLRAEPAVTAGIAEAPADAVDGNIQQVAYESPRNAAMKRAEVLDLSNPDRLPPGSMEVGDRDVIVVRPKVRRVIHVTGLVNSPDQFELMEDHDFRVLDAIAMAGGTSSTIADKVLVVRQVDDRNEPVVVRVSLSDAKSNGAENLLLQAGDLVSVESTPATVAMTAFESFFRITMGLGGNLSLF